MEATGNKQEWDESLNELMEIYGKGTLSKMDLSEILYQLKNWKQN